MPNIDQRAKLIWSLSTSGEGTTITGPGNSGSWSSANPNAESAIDLRDITDILLLVSVGGITGTPALIVTLNFFDNLGNAYTSGITSGSAIATAKNVFACGGLHGSPGIVFPSWGQVAWTQTSASVTGTEIELYGR